MPKTENEIENPEQYLWLKVIFRAQEEADGMYVYDSSRPHVMYMARKWLTCSRDFLDVCRYAGLDPDRAQDLRKAMKMKYGGKK